MLLYVLPALQENTEFFTSTATGTEWMAIASVIVPAVLLAVLVYLGSKSAV